MDKMRHTKRMWLSLLSQMPPVPARRVLRPRCLPAQPVLAASLRIASEASDHNLFSKALLEGSVPTDSGPPAAAGCPVIAPFAADGRSRPATALPGDKFTDGPPEGGTRRGRWQTASDARGPVRPPADSGGQIRQSPAWAQPPSPRLWRPAIARRASAGDGYASGVKYPVPGTPTGLFNRAEASLLFRVPYHLIAVFSLRHNNYRIFARVTGHILMPRRLCLDEPIE